MRGIPAGRIGGAPVRVGWSWVALLAVAGWAMFLRVSWDGTPAPMAAGIAAGGAVMLMASVLAHEAGHVLAARFAGIEVRGVSLMVFGGSTEMRGEPDRPVHDLAVAAAGPAATLAVGAVLAVARLPLVGPAPGAADVLGLLVVVNLGAAAFNLLPGLPLDGGRILRAAYWGVTGDPAAAERFTTFAGRLLGAALAAGGVAAAVVWRSAIPLLAAGVGWFLAAGSAAAARSTGVLATPVGSVMAAAGAAVSPESVVESSGGPVPVVEGGRVTGLVPAGELGRAGDLMVLIEPDDVVDAFVPIGEAMVRIERTGRPLVVVEDGRMVGVVAPGALVDWMRDACRGPETD